MPGKVEWDENKRKVNLEKHGIDFRDIVEAFDGVTIEASDDGSRFGEIRTIALGEVHGHVLAIVYTMRGVVRRIISVRKASRDERSQYQEALRRQDRED
jgi:uncharacterized DUF497 family protein